MSRTKYPCGYESDYNCATAAEARFLDEIDALVEDTHVEVGGDFNVIAGWLSFAANTYKPAEQVISEWVDLTGRIISEGLLMEATTRLADASDEDLRKLDQRVRGLVAGRTITK